MREIKSLTGVRGLAAVYVMFYHYANRRLALGNGTAHALIDHGYIAVDLFFALSGFVMALTYQGLFAEGSVWAAQRNFLARRVARVYPLYLIVTVIMMGLVAARLSDAAPHALLPVYAVTNLLMIQSWVGLTSLDFPAWSISTEWGAYFVFPPLLFLTLRSRPPVAVLTVVIAFAAVCLVGLLPGWTLDHPGRDGTLNVFEGILPPMTRCIAEFTLGLLAFRLSRTPAGRRLAGGGASIVLAIAILVLLAIPETDLGLAALFPLLVVSLSTDTGPVARVLASRPIHRLGVWSYAIYLLHMHASRFVQPLGARLHAAHVPHDILITITVACALTIVCSWAAFEWLEKPGRRLLQHLLMRGSKTHGAPTATTRGPRAPTAAPLSGRRL